MAGQISSEQNKTLNTVFLQTPEVNLQDLECVCDRTFDALVSCNNLSLTDRSPQPACVEHVSEADIAGKHTFVHVPACGRTLGH